MDVDTLFDVLFFHSFLLGGKRPSLSEVLSLSFLYFYSLILFAKILFQFIITCNLLTIFLYKEENCNILNSSLQTKL